MVELFNNYTQPICILNSYFQDRQKNKMRPSYFNVNKFMAIIKQSRLFFLPLPLSAIISSYVLTKNYNLIQLFWSSLSFLFLHIFVTSVNNTYDVDSDKFSNTRSNQNPIVTHDLTIQEAWIINFITSILAIVTSVFAGFYWLLLILIGIGLVVIYDIKPFRMKDKPLGIFIIPLAGALPFLFAYLNTPSNDIYFSSVFFIFTFLYLDLLSAVRLVPDYEKDMQMNVRNFATCYSIKAVQILDLIVTILLPVIFTVAVIFDYLSVLGLPLLLLITGVKFSVLIKPNNVLKNPQVWKRFAQYAVMNNFVLLIGIVGKLVS